MAKARAKAQEMRYIRNNIVARKQSLERSIASINSQQKYINQAIAKNKDMIEKKMRMMQKESRKAINKVKQML